MGFGVMVESTYVNPIISESADRFFQSQRDACPKGWYRHHPIEITRFSYVIFYSSNHNYAKAKQTSEVEATSALFKMRVNMYAKEKANLMNMFLVRYSEEGQRL